MALKPQYYCIICIVLSLALTYVYLDSLKSHVTVQPLPETSGSEDMYKILDQILQHKSEMIEVPISYVLKGEPIRLAQNDSRLVHYIKKHYLDPPSPLPYNLKAPGIDPSMGQSELVKSLFSNDKKRGFFVECGALDGETRSNTLSLERDFGWEGLLIEGDPKNYEMVRQKNRKAWTTNTCLAVKPYPHQVLFQQQFNIGKIDHIVEDSTGKVPTGKALVQCLPFYSLMTAMNRKSVDYFSLDVEGNEFDVLMTIPFDKIYIKVLSVEFKHVPGGKEKMRDFMNKKGFDVITEVTHPGNLANDFIFKNRLYKP